MEIRSKTNQYSKNKRLILKRKEIELREKIQKVNQQISDNQYFNQNILNNYELAKKELKNKYDSKGKEATFRSRLLEQGEKPTKYFFNLEKTNYDRKIVKELKDKNDQILTNFKEVNENWRPLL